MKSNRTKVVRSLVVAAIVFAVGCSDASVSFRSVENRPGTFDTDFVGAGGDLEQSFIWTNNSSRAEYAMDITAASRGRVDVVIRDADGAQVASFFLDKASPDDSLGGLTATGTPGAWTISISIQDFSGDGSVHVGSGT